MFRDPRVRVSFFGFVKETGGRITRMTCHLNDDGDVEGSERGALLLLMISHSLNKFLILKVL